MVEKQINVDERIVVKSEIVSAPKAIKKVSIRILKDAKIEKVVDLFKIFFEDLLKNYEVEVILEENSKVNFFSSYDKEINLKVNFLVFENAKLISTDFVLNKSQGNLEIVANLKGKNSAAKINTAFITKDSAKFKIKTEIKHFASNSEGQMLAKGIALDDSKMEYESEIFIDSGLVKIDSKQSMKTLMIGENSKCDALPILDVNSDDVSCSHGAAMGRISEEKLFYLESRGIDRKEAIQLILEGFLLEVFDDLKEEKSFENEIKTFLE